MGRMQIFLVKRKNSREGGFQPPSGPYRVKFGRKKLTSVLNNGRTMPDTPKILLK